jgi:DNA-binding GntR family transcriptional regulator
VLEPLAARKATKNCSKADIQRLEDLIHKEEDLLNEEDTSKTYIHNAEFRKTFFHLCGNERLGTSIDEFAGHILFYGILTLNHKNVRETVINGQLRIVEGLRPRDEGNMERIILGYLKQSHEAIMAVIN